MAVGTDRGEAEIPGVVGEGEKVEAEAGEGVVSGNLEKGDGSLENGNGNGNENSNGDNANANTDAVADPAAPPGPGPRRKRIVVVGLGMVGISFM